MIYIETVFKWILKNYIEILATVTGLIYLVYSIRGNVLLWFYGIVTSILYVYVFFISKIYADMAINFYYVVVSIYGWIHWYRKGNGNTGELPVTRLNYKTCLILTALTLVIFVFISFILKKYTDSTIVFWDALLTAGSITATWMLARKILEHWLIWIFVDALSIGLYIYKGLYPTVFLFIVYTILAFAGYFEWKKQWKAQVNH